MGSKFCRWVEILCAVIIVNGNFIKSLKLWRSVCQGCSFVSYLFVLVVDLFLLLVKRYSDIKGLQLSMGGEFKALAVADDSQIVTVIIIVVLNVCAVVIIVFCQISGMKINWSKTVVICSLSVIDKFFGDLFYVRVLQEGEIYMYFGVD